MRQFILLAVFLLALTGSRGDEKIAAPVPKTPPLPTIEGKYNVLIARDEDPRVQAFGGGLPAGFPAAGGGGRATRTFTQRTTATITTNEISFSNREVSAFGGREVIFGGNDTMVYTFDPTKTPMTIDIETTNERNKKTKSLGIVEMSGNRMTIALAKAGAERPKTTDEAEGVTVYYFQKTPPPSLPPRAEYRIVALTVGKEEIAEKELNKLTKEGYELVSTTTPLAPDAKSSVTTIHFVLKRMVKQP